jgi:predicted kinase
VTSHSAQGVLLALIGPPGAGKSTLAARLAGELPGRSVVLSLDAYRRLLSPHRDESDQSVTPQAVERLHADLDRELAASRRVVVDATNAEMPHRQALLDIADRHHAHTIAVVVLPPLAVTTARNASRPAAPGPAGWSRRVPAGAVAAMHAAISQSLPHLPAEGWKEVRHLSR